MNLLRTITTLQDYRLEKGKALIISGPAGSGKTRAATELAHRYGWKYSHATWGGVNKAFGMGAALHHSPEVVIVEEVVPDEAFFEFAKPLAAEGMIEVRQKGKDAYMAANPIWIFLTNKSVELPEGARRFDVITLTGGGS